MLSLHVIDLNNNNKLIFSVKHNPIVESEYEALFYMSLDEKINQSTINSEKNNPKLLTCYPEKLEILKEANIFQFRNRYGTALYDVKQDSLNWVKRSAEIEKSSTAFIPVYHNRLPPLSVSPDGKYIFYIEQTSAAKGKLVVKSVETNSVLVVASDIEYGYDFVPVKWSSDSSIAIYENKGNLFFLNESDKNLFELEIGIVNVIPVPTLSKVNVFFNLILINRKIIIVYEV